MTREHKRRAEIQRNGVAFHEDPSADPIHPWNRKAAPCYRLLTSRQCKGAARLAMGKPDIQGICVCIPQTGVKASSKAKYLSMGKSGLEARMSAKARVHNHGIRDTAIQILPVSPIKLLAFPVKARSRRRIWLLEEYVPANDNVSRGESPCQGFHASDVPTRGPRSTVIETTHKSRGLVMRIQSDGQESIVFALN